MTETIPKYQARPADKLMLEKDIERRVGDYAKKLGVKTYKFTSPSQRSVPDRIYVFPNGVLFFIEFKRYGEKPTRGQEIELDALAGRGQRVAIIDNVEDGKALVDWVMRLVPSA